MSGADASLARGLNDLLLPLVKGPARNGPLNTLSSRCRCLADPGYLADHPIAQYVRDAKIDSLYEGTTAIQADDFLFRKIVKNKGVAMAHLLERVARCCDDRVHAELAEHEKLLETALSDVEEMTSTMCGYVESAGLLPDDVYRAGLRAVPYLLAVADLLVGWLLLRQAQVALSALEGTPSGSDHAFYRGKVAVAKFFTTTVLPRLSAERVITAHQDLDAMDLAHTSF